MICKITYMFLFLLRSSLSMFENGVSGSVIKLGMLRRGDLVHLNPLARGPDWSHAVSVVGVQVCRRSSFIE